MCWKNERREGWRREDDEGEDGHVEREGKVPF